MRLATRVHLDLRNAVCRIQCLIQECFSFLVRKEHGQGGAAISRYCTHASAQRLHETSKRDARRVQVRGDMENSNMVKKLR